MTIDLHQASVAIIRAGQHRSGAYIASPNFSQYGYSWLRDGTWIAYGMARAGQIDSAEAFFRWGVKVLTAQQSRVEALLDKLAGGETPLESDYLPTRFTLDGEIGTEAWTDFQLDGYGTWLWGIATHCGSVDHPLWREAQPAIKLVIAYLQALWQSPNYDCWEEHRNQIHTATLAAIYGGLRAIQQLDATLIADGLPEQIQAFALANCVAAEGHFCKYVGNAEVDSSLLWVAVPYGLVEIDDPRFVATLMKIERDLRVPDGGVYRYCADNYYGGGEWNLLTAWLGWTYLLLARLDEARDILRWIETQATPTGELPEQTAGHLLLPSYYPDWVAKWGNPAVPLLWSHGMYLTLESLLKDAEKSL
ncbi:MAG: glycoside hydrolase family 15 protein [Anaerolineae bacterium]|nr:glycoside hydrolase family 15 protein [Anaerolineae bacterium]